MRYMKMAKATRKLPTPWNWAAAQWLKSSSVLKERGPLRSMSSKEAGRTCWTSHPNAFFERLARERCQHCCKDWRGGGDSLLMLRPFAALYIKLVCMAITPVGIIFWRRYIRKLANSLLKTCQQSTWITGTMSNGLMRWKLICLVPIASSMCAGDLVRSTKISVSCLQSSMVVGMSWSKAAWVLQVLESYISLRETWTPTCTVKYCSRAWSPPSRNWVSGQCSSMTMTPNTPPRRPLIYWRGWG